MPAHQGLVRRIYAGFLATALLPAIVAVGIGAWAALDRLRDATVQGLQQEVSARAGGLRRFFTAASAQMNFLAADPDARKLLSVAGSAQQAVLAARITAEYARLVQAQADIYQLRLLDAKGMERVRVDRRPEGSVVVPDQLQDKSDRYYVREALTQPADTIYMSPLDLNVEHGQVELPERPVVRLATVVRGEDGAVGGIVVMNLHAQVLIAPVQQMVQSRAGTAYLFDGSGQYLARDRDAAGSFLMQPVARLEGLHPAVHRQLLDPNPGHLLAAGFLWAHAPLDFPHDTARARWAIAIAIPDTLLREQVFDVTVLSSVLLGALLLAAVAGYSVSHRLIGPLTQLAREADAIAAGDFQHRVHIRGHDEIAVLGERFNLMAARLEATLSQLEQHRHQLQAEVTERTRDLAAERARLAAVLRHASDAIAALRVEGELLFANPAAERLLQELAGGVSGATPVLKRLAGGGEGGREELAIGDRTLSVSRTVLPPPAGAGELVIVARDVSEERRLADEMRERDRQLFQLDKLATLGELAMGLAHEIGNPLAGMKAVVQSLLLDPELPGALRDDLQRLESEVDRLARFLGSFRGLAGSRQPQLSPQPLADAVDDMLFWVRKPAQGAGVRILVDIDPQLPPLAADAAQLREVLLNLFVNALHAMPQGGDLQVRGYAAGAQALIAVCDSGIGIPSQLQREIFKPFFTTRADGTGLGLAVCAKVVEDHGGRIEVDSRPGDTCLRLYWPLHAAQPADNAAWAPAS